ncbi:unnamed protein product [Lathyrus sativus]|nr:unnamed protein product [Lathyrus sativus]
MTSVKIYGNAALRQIKDLSKLISAYHQYVGEGCWRIDYGCLADKCVVTSIDEGFYLASEKLGRKVKMRLLFSFFEGVIMLRKSIEAWQI